MISITVNSGAQHRGGRRATVNERVETILHGKLVQEEQRAQERRGDSDVSRARRLQLATLYTASVEDKFLRTRAKVAERSKSGSQSVPKHVQLSHRRGNEIPPFNARDAGSPGKQRVRCFAEARRQQLQQEEEAEREKRVATQFPAPEHGTRKPWYTGYSRAHQAAPTCTMDAKIRRYGAYGTAKMLAVDTASGTAPPFKLYESQSLELLSRSQSPDAWCPGLQGSPSTWPEDATFATGCQLQATKMVRCPSPDFRFPTHCVGKPAPSLDEDVHYHRTRAAHDDDTRNLERSLALEKLQRGQEAVYNRDKLAHWKAQLRLSPLPAHRLDQEVVTVTATQARELTILRTPQFSMAARHDEQVARLTAQRFTLRWRHLAQLLDVMKRTPCRRPVLQDVDKLLALANELSLRNLHAMQLTRQQFADLMAKEYPGVSSTLANRVFSSYDYHLSDAVDMRVLLATVRALRVQRGTPIEMLTLALQDWDTTRRRLVGAETTLRNVLSLCCASEEEEEEMHARATALWPRMQQRHAEEKEKRRQRRGQRRSSLSTAALALLSKRVDGDGEKEDEDDGGDGDGDDEEMDEEEEGDDDDDPQCDLESLLSIGSREGETRAVPIRCVRRELRCEKEALRRFSELLMARRQECAQVLVDGA